MESGLVEIYQDYRRHPFTGVASNTPYEPLEGSTDDTAARDQARDTFLESDAAWPELTFAKVQALPLEDHARGYWNVLNRVVAHEEDHGETPESQIVYELAARKLAETYRHQEVVRRLGLHAVEAVELSRKRAGVMSEELFGEIDQKSFDQLFMRDLSTALSAIQSSDLARAELGKQYLSHVGLSQEEAIQKLAEAPAENMLELHDETITIIRGDLLTLFPKLEHMDRFITGKPVPARDAKPAFDGALDVFGLREKGWTSKTIKGSAASAKTTGGKIKAITWGEGRDDFKGTGIVRTPVHEATHAKHIQMAAERGKDGEQIGGMPGTLGFSEGFPIAIEEILTGEKRIPGEKYYRQLGLETGMHLPEDQRRDLSQREVYEIQWRREALLTTGALIPEKIDAIQKSTYKLVMRTERGGARDNRDINYYDGGLQGHRFFNETAQLPREIRLRRLEWAFSGSFNPYDPVQAELYGGDPAAEYLAAYAAA